MKLEIRCGCGQVYHADPTHAGRAIRCRCGQVLPIRPAPGPPAPRRRFAFPRFRWPGFPRVRLPRLGYRPLTVSPRIARALRRLAWGYLGAVLLYTGLLWFFGERWWVATVLLFVPRWPVLLPAGPLAVAVLLIRPRLLLPVAAATFLAVVPAMGFRLGIRGWLTGADRSDVRVITFNIDAIDNVRLFVAPLALQTYEPDVVVFQECAEALTRPEHWPAGWSVRFDQQLCLATRYPIIGAKAIEEVRTGTQGGTGQAMFYRLQSPSGPVDLAVVHLETPRKGLEPLRYGGGVDELKLNALVRDVGSMRIRRWITEQSKDPIVLGDFNMPVESRIYRDHWSDCTNAFSSVGHGFGWTRVLRRFSIRIDHVLTCSGWRPLRAVVGPDLGSDHRPLIVDLARKR